MCCHKCARFGAHTRTQCRIIEQLHHLHRECLSPIGNKKVLFVLGRNSRPGRGGYDTRQAHRHGFQDLVLDTATHAQRYNSERRGTEIGSNIREVLTDGENALPPSEPS